MFYVPSVNISAAEQQNLTGMPSLIAVNHSASGSLPERNEYFSQHFGWKQLRPTQDALQRWHGTR
jgi:hypothetical protein